MVYITHSKRIRTQTVSEQNETSSNENNEFIHIVHMKKSLIASCLLLFSCVAFGQQIKSKSVEIDDLMDLLKSSGYELFSFDITDMLNETYDIVFVFKEYAAGREIVSIDSGTEHITHRNQVKKISFGI